MSTIDNIISLLQDQHKSQKDLTDFLGISKNAFTDWKSGRIKSYAKYLPEIAEFLNVSVDYLLGKEKEHTANQSDMPGIFDKYVLLNEDDRQSVDIMIESLLQKDIYKQKKDVG